MTENHDLARVHVWVKGRVQGVGFRAYVDYIARQFDVTGWVRNVGYDTVETVAEGSRTELERFVETVKAGPRGASVDESKEEWENPTGEFTEFGIKRSM